MQLEHSARSMQSKRSDRGVNALCRHDTATIKCREEKIMTKQIDATAVAMPIADAKNEENNNNLLETG
jgi:hypothetical protein